MSGWLIGIVGVVSLGVLIEVLLPEGENSKYIRGIFSIIVIFVIISPLPKLAKGDYIKGFVTKKEEILMKVIMKALKTICKIELRTILAKSWKKQVITTCPST